jgi:hypothetical protein
MALASSALSLLKSEKTRGAGVHRSSDNPYKLNRYVGGHNRTVHPYVSGYWYVLIQLPATIYYASNRQTEEVWLHSAAESFNPPSRTLTKVDVPGLGGLGSSFIAGQQLTRTFTCAFREYQDTPIFNTINTWTSTIDHHYGVSPLGGNEYIPANYKGSAWVFLCKPTLTGTGTPGTKGNTSTSDFGSSATTSVTSSEGSIINKEDVEQFYFFEGVFPEGAPFDSFTSDISTNDVLQLSVTFSFDGWPYGKEHNDALEKGLNHMNTFSTAETFDYHIAKEAKTFSMPGENVKAIPASNGNT